VAPYTPNAPKKIYMYHLHHVDQTARVNHSTWEMVAIDSTPVGPALPIELASVTPQPLSDSIRLALFPASRFMQV
jgi:hypothetical protein